MAKYRTKQRDSVLAYLQSRASHHVTAAQVCAHFAQQNEPIGQATVYRHLDALAAEGVVRKYDLGGTGGSCFEYCGDQARCAPNCFHCKCTKCGRLIHLACDQLAGIEQHVRDDHGFHIDPQRTVFYGLCEECAAHA